MVASSTPSIASRRLRLVGICLVALVGLTSCLAFASASEGSCGGDAPASASNDASEMCMAPPESLPAASAPLVLSTLARVRARGRLICAHCDDTLGHSAVRSNTSASGMEPELCKGLAAALGVQPSFWLMRTPSERFPLLQASDVDVVFALTSKTLQRDMHERGTFSIPYFHDQHNMMVRSDAGIHSASDLRGKTICVTAGTTNPNVFADYLASVANDIGGVGNVKVETVPDDAQALQMMHDNVCHGFVNDDSVVAGYVHVATPPAGVKYVLASWAGTPFARAPFSALTLDGDNEFASIVDWFVNSLFLAEMYDVTSENADERANDPSLPGEAQRLLGRQLVGGHKLDFDILAAIKAIGNYAQVYERNFGAFLPRSRANILYQNGGAVFPGGFR